MALASIYDNQEYLIISINQQQRKIPKYIDLIFKYYIISQENLNIMASRLNKIDDDEFQILLSMEDYQQLKGYEGKLKNIQPQMKAMKARELKLLTERDDLSKQLASLRQQTSQLPKSNQLLSSSCQRLRQKAQSEFTLFFSTISTLCKSCNIPFIAKPVYDYVSHSMSPSDIILSDFYIIQGILQQMSKYLSVIAQPIESMLTGNKLIHEALVKEHERVDEEMESLRGRCQKLMLERAQLQKEYKLQIGKLHNELQHQRAQLQRQISQLRRQNTQLIAKLTRSQTQRLSTQKDNDLLQQQNTQLHHQMKQLQQDNVECQQHIKILKSKQHRGNQNNKIHKKGVNVNNNKFQKQGFIKQTLVEYAREVKNNLIAIGTLSQDEIKQIGVSELKMLVKFIHQLEEDFQ